LNLVRCPISLVGYYNIEHHLQDEKGTQDEMHVSVIETRVSIIEAKEIVYEMTVSVIGTNTYTGIDKLKTVNGER